jgi:TolB protein
MKRSIALLTAVVTGSGVLLAAAPAHATAHGKNGRIAFRRYYNADHTRGDIFTIGPHGAGERQLTHTKRTRLATEPDWSPNGRWIVYQVERGGAPNIKVVKIRRDGTHRTSLSQTCHGQCLDDSQPAWSANGRRIAVVRELCSTGSNNLLAIYTIGADGEQSRRITHRDQTRCARSHRFEDGAPGWAPDGDHIAFARFDTQRSKNAIFTVRLNGTRVHRISPWRLDADQPDYSPDGRWILFRTHEGSDTQGNIWLVHPNGEGLHAVTHTPAGSGKWQSGSFSPNGKKITAGKAPGVGATGNADVYVMNIDGSALRNVTKSAPWESAPDWGPRRR